MGFLILIGLVIVAILVMTFRSMSGTIKSNKDTIAQKTKELARMEGQLCNLKKIVEQKLDLKIYEREEQFKKYEEQLRKDELRLKSERERLEKDKENYIKERNRIVEAARKEAEEIRRNEFAKVAEDIKKEKEKYIFNEKRFDAINVLIQDTQKKSSVSLKWLADQYQEFWEWSERNLDYLCAFHKAEKTGEKFKLEHSRRMETDKELAYFKGLVSLYEKYVPWIAELREQDSIKINREENNVADEFDDETRSWLTLEEYAKLNTIERNQLALDRYQKRHKTKSEIGRDYESYVRYLYEKKGYSVEYKGMVDGFEDLGRDLICKKENEILIIQCKCWSTEKQIHEKHINQLLGTTFEYAIANKCNTTLADFSERERDLFNQCPMVIPVFYTTTQLSEKAKMFAERLGVKVYEKKPLDEYPCIKCNISSSGEKIYHLPFDQQYNVTIIEKEKGEIYTFDVQTAEKNGFRRARRRFVKRN